MAWSKNSWRESRKDSKALLWGFVPDDFSSDKERISRSIFREMAGLAQRGIGNRESRGAPVCPRNARMIALRCWRVCCPSPLVQPFVPLSSAGAKRCPQWRSRDGLRQGWPRRNYPVDSFGCPALGSLFVFMAQRSSVPSSSSSVMPWCWATLLRMLFNVPILTGSWFGTTS